MEKSESVSNNTTSSAGVGNSQQRRRNNRQRKPKNKNNHNNNQQGSETPVPVTTTEDRSTSNNASRNRNRNRHRNKKKNGNGDNSNNVEGNDNNKPTRKNKHPPKYMEIQRLLHKFKPITINGIPTTSLSKPANEFLLDLVSDKSSQDSIYIAFLMEPSDPDFPYELDVLKVSLAIPSRYPGRSDQAPSITVLNDDIPRGFSINIELGFQQIVATALKNREFKKKGNKSSKEASSAPNTENEEDDEAQKIEIVSGNDLLGMILTLDKYLERFLAMEKKDTIKIVKYIKRQQNNGNARDTKGEKKEKSKEKNEMIKNEVVLVLTESIQKRNAEIEKMKQRLRLDTVKLFKETAHNSIYKMSLSFKEENFTIEIENMEEIVIENLNVKLTIPKDYLSNPKKGLKLELDMSNDYNLKLISSIKDKDLKLVFGKLINNINNNFNHLGSEVAKLNVSEKKGEEELLKLEPEQTDENSNSNYWSITSQLNFFVQNIEKFLSPVNEFGKWLENNRLLNRCL